MICPICKNPNTQECAEEVDIGVGTLKHVYGFDCPTCGQISICNQCGALEGFQSHALFCGEPLTDQRET